MAHSPPAGGGGQPLVVSLNCLDDPSLEQEGLAGVAAVEHVALSAVASGRVEAAAAVLLPSLAFLPRAAQRRLRPWQLLLCLGSADRAADAAASSTSTPTAPTRLPTRSWRSPSACSAGPTCCRARPPPRAPPPPAACPCAAASCWASLDAPPLPAASPPAALPSG
jgi:hypothetical protein